MMAYYTPSYSDLGRHRKTKRLMRALGVAMPATMGHLHLFWHWVLEFAPNGDISFDRFTCEDIADGALWEGDAYAFLEALVTAGFVDRNDDRLAVHEWHEYGGAYFEKLEKDRERKRNKGNPEESPVVPAASDGVPVERAGIPRNSTAFPQKNRKEKEEINTPPTPSPGEPADKPPRASRGTRIPPGFALTPALYAYAAEKGVTATEADSETEEFKLFWESASGAYALKTDWEKTWMRRILEQVKAGKIGPAAHIGSTRSNGYRSQASINRGGQKNSDGTPRWSE